VRIVETELPLWLAENPRWSRRNWYFADRVVIKKRRAIVRVPAPPAISKSEDARIFTSVD
jgi:hypothetical protein